MKIEYCFNKIKFESRDLKWPQYYIFQNMLLEDMTTNSMVPGSPDTQLPYLSIYQNNCILNTLLDDVMLKVTNLTLEYLFI